MTTKTSPVLTGNTDVAVALDEQPRTLFFYGTTTEKKKNKFITRRVAYAGVISGSAIRLGKAVCSLKDSFIKKKARAIAQGRAIKAPEDVIYLTDDTTVAKQFVKHVSKLVDPIEIPDK